MRQSESGRGTTLWICEKWSEEACEFVRKRLGLEKFAPVSSRLMRQIVRVPDIGEEAFEGNLLLNAGITLLLNQLSGIDTVANNYWSATRARIGVGDSSTAAAASQTALQAATNKTYAGMNATFPSVTGQTISYQADFTTGNANYSWQEWTIDNTVPTALNRKVASLGTKTTGLWTLTGQLTIA
jgi:hypothetical protein